MPNIKQTPSWGKTLKRPSLWVAKVTGTGCRENESPLPHSTSPHTTHKEQEMDTTRLVTGLQSAVIPRFHGVGVRVVKGTLQVGSGLAL